MCQSTESCRDFKEALQALSLRGSECGVKISKAHTAVVNDRAAGIGQTESRNFLEDDATPARLLGFLFVFVLLWVCVHWKNPVGDNLIMIH